MGHARDDDSAGSADWMGVNLFHKPVSSSKGVGDDLIWSMASSSELITMADGGQKDIQTDWAAAAAAAVRHPSEWFIDWVMAISRCIIELLTYVHRQYVFILSPPKVGVGIRHRRVDRSSSRGYAGNNVVEKESWAVFFPFLSRLSSYKGTVNQTVLFGVKWVR